MISVDEAYQLVEQNIKVGTVTTKDFNMLIEALPKGTKEAIHRRTRKEPQPAVNSPAEVTPKRKGDSNPQKGRGKRYKSGSAARKKLNAEISKTMKAEEIAPKFDPLHERLEVQHALEQQEPVGERVLKLNGKIKHLDAFEQLLQTMNLYV